MDFKKHLVTAWNLTIKFIVPLVLMTLVMSIVSLLTFGILMPVTMAGYMHSILLMLRERREPRVGDLFSQMRLFFPLLGFMILVIFIALLGFILLVLPGFLVIVAVFFFCLYMLPLMVDRRKDLLGAIRQSYDMALENLAEHLVVVVLYLGITGVGSSVFIGWLFTQPFATVLLLPIYDERVKTSGLNFDINGYPGK